MIVEINSPAFALLPIERKVVTAFNPKTNRYSLAIAAPDKTITDKSRAAGAETLPRLLGMFEE
jgi:hypothetical protein